MSLTVEEAIEVTDTNRKSIISQVEKYKNTLVLFSFQVVELLDWVDGEDDFYWVYSTGREVHWSSCVGGFLPLIDLPKERYDKLKLCWDRNDAFKWDDGESLAKIKTNGWTDEDYCERMRNSEEGKILSEIFK